MSVLEILLAFFIMVVSGFGTLILFNFKEFKIALKEMASSVVQLNIKLERVITDQAWHKEDIKEIKERLDALEHKE